MVVTLSLDERKRRSRNILLAAFALLIIIWTIKLSFPQHTVLSVYTNHDPTTSSEPPSSISAGNSAPSQIAGNSKSKPHDNLVLATDINTTNSSKPLILKPIPLLFGLLPIGLL